MKDRTVRASAERVGEPHRNGKRGESAPHSKTDTGNRQLVTGNWPLRSRYNQIESRNNFTHRKEHLHYILLILELQVDAVVLNPDFTVGVL